MDSSNREKENEKMSQILLLGEQLQPKCPYGNPTFVTTLCLCSLSHRVGEKPAHPGKVAVGVWGLQPSLHLAATHRVWPKLAIGDQGWDFGSYRVLMG